MKKQRRGPGGGETLADQCENLILRSGPMSIQQLEKLTGKNYDSLYSVLNHDKRFTSTGNPAIYKVKE
jgi:hypothetical protein